ncbi:MAG: class I SAM-dependent methyltransferase [Burkholderiales bacterium]
MLGRILSGVWRSLRSRGREPANPLADYFFANPGRRIQKWHHYFEIYHRHFQAFRGRSPVVLEIGVFHGGSLQMWKRYFGPGARIVGVDIDPRCRGFEEPGIEILIGDQADRAFLAGIRARLPRIDIVIDDGGHAFPQQIASFEELYPHLQPEGVYLCEDLHTSYAPNFGGGYRRDGTFVEYAKGLVDRLHAWYSFEPARFAVDALTRSTYALHFYDSVLAIEKRPIAEPQQSMTGTPSF